MRMATRAKPGLFRNSLRANFRFCMIAAIFRLSIEDRRSNFRTSCLRPERAWYQCVLGGACRRVVSTGVNGCPVLDSVEGRTIWRREE